MIIMGGSNGHTQLIGTCVEAVEEQQNKFNKDNTPFVAKVYCRGFFTKPCRFEYECEWRDF